MIEKRFVHGLRCKSDAYLRCVLDDEYNRRLYVDALKYAGFRTLERVREDNFEVRRSQVYPAPATTPSVILKVFDDLSYVEEAKLDPAKNHVALNFVAKSLTERIKIFGEITCVDRSDGTCERTATMSVDARILGIGGILERSIMADMARGYELAVTLAPEYIREMGW